MKKKRPIISVVSPNSNYIQINGEVESSLQTRSNGGSGSLSHFRVGDKNCKQTITEEEIRPVVNSSPTSKEQEKEMVLNSSLVVTVANVSANLCQYIACNPERLPNDQVLHLLFCLPFQHARRVALSAWACLLFPAGDDTTSASSSSISSSYGSDSDLPSRDREDLHSD